MFENEKDLDEKTLKRLKELSNCWEGDEYAKSKIDSHDMKILLKYFAPLRNLIRQIIHAESNVSNPTPLRVETAAYEHKNHAAELANLQTECKQLADNLQTCTQASAQLLQDKKTLQQQLAQATEDYQTLEKHYAAQEKQGQQRETELAKLHKQHQQLQQKLEQCQHTLEQERRRPSAVHPAVTLLRQDSALATDLGLPDLPADDDLAALQQTVAVLSQSDSLKRLWDILKTRTEAHNRPATAQERELLETALAWHNHNWRSRPYSLVAPVAGSGFDFNHHQRCKPTPSGETIASLWVPGIADAGGKAFCKCLVNTK